MCIVLSGPTFRRMPVLPVLKSRDAALVVACRSALPTAIFARDKNNTTGCRYRHYLIDTRRIISTLPRVNQMTPISWHRCYGVDDPGRVFACVGLQDWSPRSVSSGR